MRTIQLDVSDELVSEIGLKAIRKYLQEQINFIKVERLASKIENSVMRSGIDLDNELDKAREKAWEERKKGYQ